MKYIMTPFCLTRDIMMKDPMATFARPEKHVVQPLSGYEERQTIEIEEDSDLSACENIWNVFQNLTEDHLTPDGGRSLMVGDMVRMNKDGEVSWWICCSFGWEKTVAPNELRQEVG